MSWIVDFHPWIKALHVISVIAWMVGMLYLPRLFVYHADRAPGSEASELLKVMERRLLHAIVNPAMMGTLIFGGLLLATPDMIDWSAWWIHAKLVLVVIMLGLHGAFSRWRLDFEADRNTRPPRFYRFANEVPTLLLIAIVILALVRPG